MKYILNPHYRSCPEPWRTCLLPWSHILLPGDSKQKQKINICIFPCFLVSTKTRHVACSTFERNVFSIQLFFFTLSFLLCFNMWQCRRGTSPTFCGHCAWEREGFKDTHITLYNTDWMSQRHGPTSQTCRKTHINTHTHTYTRARSSHRHITMASFCIFCGGAVGLQTDM